MYSHQWNQNSNIKVTYAWFTGCYMSLVSTSYAFSVGLLEMTDMFVHVNKNYTITVHE